jgi:hypothetical protein
MGDNLGPNGLSRGCAGSPAGTGGRWLSRPYGGLKRTRLVPHSRKLTISGRTEADKRVMVMARASGVLTDLRVKRANNLIERWKWSKHL